MSAFSGCCCAQFWISNVLLMMVRQSLIVPGKYCFQWKIHRLANVVPFHLLVDDHNDGNSGSSPCQVDERPNEVSIVALFTRRSATGHAQKLRPRWNVGEIEKAANLIFSGFTSSSSIYFAFSLDWLFFLFKCMFRGGFCRVAISAEWPLTADQLTVTKLVSLSLFRKISAPSNNFIEIADGIIFWKIIEFLQIIQSAEPEEDDRHVIDSCCSSRCGGGDLIRS